MLSLPLGIIAFIGVMFYAASGANGSNYVNMHAFVIVIAGTAVVFATSNATSVMALTWGALKSLFKERPSMDRVKPDLMKLAQDRSSVTSSHDPLLTYALALWERGVDPNQFQALISQYRDKLENDDVEAISAIQNLSKYPPALGMLGTVMGMITLFASLGGSDKSGLGPALATAMTATFYGLALANGILMPIADRINVEAANRKKYYGLVYEIITMLNRREPVSMIQEEITLREAA